MPWPRLIALLLGLAVLVLVLVESDLGAVAAALADLGAEGALAVAAVYFLAFLVDTASWQLMLPGLALTPGWLYRLWKVRMVGEALNLVLPAASFGGEPLKAVLLKRHHGVGYRDGTASLIIARTVNLLALLLFAGFGLAVMLASPKLPPAYDTVAAAGLTVLTCGVLGFYAVQRWRVAGRLTRLLARWRLAQRLEVLAGHIGAVDDGFHRFYVGCRGRFVVALALALLNWCLGAAEVYVAMAFLGSPVSPAQALMTETLLQLVRAGTFFIPASIGASEASAVLIVDLLTGRPALGLALALVRRGRELLWVLWGLWVGWSFSATPPDASE